MNNKFEVNVFENPVNVIKKMYELSKSVNCLEMDICRPDSIEGVPVKDEVFNLIWHKDDPNKIQYEFDSLRQSIRTIAAGSTELKKSDQDKFFETYLAPLNIEYSEFSVKSLLEDIDLLEEGQILSEPDEENTPNEEQKEILRDYYRLLADSARMKAIIDFDNACESAAASRIGNAPLAFHVIRRAQRLYKFYQIDAPKVVVNAEECRLAAAFVIHQRAL